MVVESLPRQSVGRWCTKGCIGKCLQSLTCATGLPAAGYVKIQFYIPYFMRIGDAYADPLLRGVSNIIVERGNLRAHIIAQILESAISEHDIDLYSSNMAGVPILARTGGSDDNVPPLHSRRLIRMVNEWSRRTTAAK